MESVVVVDPADDVHPEGAANPADADPFEDPPPTAAPPRPETLGPRHTFVMLCATGFGTGWSPVAPGTVGTLLGIPLAFGLLAIPMVAARVAVLGVLVLIGIPVCGIAQRILGEKDPGSIVYDEIVAMAAVLVFLEWDVFTVVAGFLWFRVFDILKPPPLARLERIPGGAGVMADDLGAAAYALVAVLMTIWLRTTFAG